MNYRIFHVINGWAGRSAVLDAAMTFAATTLLFVVAVVAAAIVAYALYRRRFRAVIRTVAALATGFALNVAVGLLDLEHRPFQAHRVTQLIPHEAGGSLPSDHATAAFTVGLAIATFLYGRWGAAILVAGAVIGVSRIWVGVHYPADILASLIVAAVAVASVTIAERAVTRRATRATRLPTTNRSS